MVQAREGEGEEMTIWGKDLYRERRFKSLRKRDRNGKIQEVFL